MSNRRPPDRRPDRDRSDRPPQRRGDWQPREHGGGDRPYQPRPSDRPPYQPRGGDRPYQPRGGGDRPSYQPRGGGDRPFTPRPQFERAPDEGGMSIRLDPRRVNALKHLAGEAGVRPGDLVRQWVEERIDASRTSGDTAPSSPGGESLLSRLEALSARVAALESARTVATPAPVPAASAVGGPAVESPPRRGGTKRAPKKRTSAKRVALHDEMIAIIRERGPMRAGDLADAIVERGRYTVPRSGKPLDAKTVSQRVSNPTYRSRFVRSEGRIGLAEEVAAAS